MPYKSIKAAKDAGFPTKAEDIDLTLAQINKLADIHDAIKEAGTAKNPMAVAWTQWKKIYKKDGKKWVKRDNDMPDKEIRFIAATELRVERSEEGHAGKISGYAAVFNRDSADMGFIEQIAPGAFTNALERSDVRALVNHDPNLIVGRQNVNLNLFEDSRGLYMELERPRVQSDRWDQLAADIENGFITQQSFGFTVETDEWHNLDAPQARRTIIEIRELFDVSPVTFPAYPDTSVALRSLGKAKSAATSGDDKPSDEIIRRNKNLQLQAELTEII